MLLFVSGTPLAACYRVPGMPYYQWVAKSPPLPNATFSEAGPCPCPPCLYTYQLSPVQVGPPRPSIQLSGTRLHLRTFSDNKRKEEDATRLRSCATLTPPITLYPTHPPLPNGATTIFIQSCDTTRSPTITPVCNLTCASMPVIVWDQDRERNAEYHNPHIRPAP